jgi:phage head maturation protease
MDAMQRAYRLGRLLQGRGFSISGALLTDTSKRGALALLDPDTGGELAADADPAWILSTPREASDGHIVTLNWDLDRGAEGGPGIPVLYNHDRNSLIGQWRSLGVSPVETARYTGEALIGRSFLPGVTQYGRDRAAEVRAGILMSTSIGWIPGEKTRRSDLDTDDPSWREAGEDECGSPTEGFVMGSAADPNRLMEASLVTIPAQGDAVGLAQSHSRAARTLQGLLSRDEGRSTAEAESGGLDRLLFHVARHPAARGWILRIVRDELSALMAEAGLPHSPGQGNTLGDILS